MDKDKNEPDAGLRSLDHCKYFSYTVVVKRKQDNKDRLLMI